MRAAPFARLFAGTVVRADGFSLVAPSPGPLIERIAGAPGQVVVLIARDIRRVF